MRLIRHRTFAWVLAAAVALAMGGTSVVGQKQEEKKLTREQRQEVEALVKLVDSTMGGEAAPSDFPIGWQNDFLKAQEGRTYAPFTLTVDASALTSPSVALYLRAIPRGGEQGQKAKKEDREVTYPFEDVYFLELKSPDGAQHHISRALALPGGEYDVYVLLKEWTGKRPRDAKAVKTSLLKQPLTVPNFHSSELTTSTVIVADRVEPLTAPLPPEQQAENPYSLGTTRIVPALDAKFGKKDVLNVIFLIYNPQLTANKPDVSVEYNFHQVASGGEKYFNKTNPQQFNAQTLPPQFDLAAGHQLIAGQSVPLASFPAGDYRLEIKITDKVAGKSVTRDVRFTVAES